MRGALSRISSPRDILLIIPADAGSTSLTVSHPSTQRDHPRGCGEHNIYYSGHAFINWIIPADAGSTNRWAFSADEPKDHPRGCGEHTHRCPAMIACVGSSPRMRGAPAKMRNELQATRIIPADAGSTYCISLAACSLEDHPRGCGEHEIGQETVEQFVGSSPPMRGTRLKKRL